ncbi:AdoMet-homocysteine methyltransferase [Tulasnella sp. 403]|nr:AdoMet-homocysteine methyltransferase [Tulasnella sp. 403]
MRKAVEIADEARKRFIGRQHEPSLGYPGEDDKYWECEPPLAVCLSLGPYGATLSPPQEFDGLYPPPYGPCGHASNPPNATESNSPNPTTAFASSPTDDDTMPEDSAVDALSAFHLRRLRVFACDKETWAKVDCVAFETVPLVREAMAIRRAVGQLVSEMNVEGTEWEMKPWYISFVFPNGEFPQERWCGGPKMDVETVVRAALVSGPPSSEGNIARPSGLGINCTEPRFIASIVRQMSEALGKVDGGDGPRPWLVLYPNGGETYDIESRTWHKSLTVTGEASYEDQWAADVLQTIPNHHTQDQWSATNGPWGGTLLGGCCKTGPVHIEALARHIKGTSAR